MIVNVFTMSILCVPLKPNTFSVSFPEMIRVEIRVDIRSLHYTTKTTTERDLEEGSDGPGN